MSTRKCVYITGGSSGIGLGLAQHYAKSGDDLVLLARDQKKLDTAVDVCKQCSRDPGQKVVAVSVDITAYGLVAPLLALPALGISDRLYERGREVVAE